MIIKFITEDYFCTNLQLQLLTVYTKKDKHENVIWNAEHDRLVLENWILKFLLVQVMFLQCCEISLSDITKNSQFFTCLIKSEIWQSATLDLSTKIC